jgi:predicted transcriptional regulator YheO
MTCCKNPFYAVNLLGHEIYSRLDKLAFVSDLSEEDNEVLFKRLGEMKTTQVYSIKNRKTSKRECGELYHRALEIRLTSKPQGHPVALVIHYRPRQSSEGKLRMLLIVAQFVWNSAPSTIRRRN